MNTFLIYAPTYDDNKGGSLVLHRLCHLINELTQHSAYIVPFRYPIKQTHRRIRKFFTNTLFKPTGYKTNVYWNTPIWSKFSFPRNAIAIYPEITEGNPLEVKNIVRWLLHQPGFHTGNILYGSNELHFKFNSAIKDFYWEGCTLSRNELKVIYYPIDTYYENKEISKTIESCYMVRKGKEKPFIHPNNSVCLDGKSHQEISDIFQKSKRFYCYDDYTAYSIFAILSGCQSIVVPDDNTSLTQWYPNETDRYGIAYGLSEEQLLWAEQTKHKVLEHILREHKKSDEQVIVCVNEMCDFFKD